MSEKKEIFIDPKIIQELVIKDQILPDGTVERSYEITDEKDLELYNRLASKDIIPGAKADNYRKARLTDAIDAFIADKSRTWATGTKNGNNSILGTFKDIISFCLNQKITDIQLTQINLKVIQDYIAALLRIPADRHTNKAFKGQPTTSLLKKPSPQWTTVAPSTALNHLGQIEGFWNWVMAQPDYDAYGVDFKQEKKILRKKIDEENRERPPFSLDQLKTLFDAEKYKEAATRPYRHWIPLIALYTGMRVTEIAQMHLSDIRKEDGVDFFDINASAPDKRLKNKNSRRTIPIHSALKALGFMDYVQDMRQAGHVHLFPELDHGSARGCGATVSQWFTKYRNSIGLKDSGVVFHSFRHTVPDKLRAARVLDDITRVLIGHKIDGSTQRYGRGYDYPQKSEAIEKISYVGLDLSDLQYTKHMKKMFANAIKEEIDQREAAKRHKESVKARKARQSKTEP